MNTAVSPETTKRPRRLAGASVGIPPRQLDFRIPEDAPRYFAADNATATTFMAVLSAFFPPGEDFFVDSVRRFRDRIEDPELKAQVAGFIGQEAIHGREHERLNDMFRARGIDVDVPDRAVRMALAVLERLPARQQLACTTFMEHFTALVGEQLLEDVHYQEQLDEEMQQLWLWHALEELEHKAVAYDVYEQVGNRHLERLLAYPLVAGVMLPAVFASWGWLLAREGRLTDLKDLRKGLALTIAPKGLIGRIIPHMGLFARKDFHPSKRDTTRLEKTWRERLFGKAGTLTDQVRNLAASAMH